MPRLPLFPLGGLLVPGEVLGLQLFEPRYLQLHRDLTLGDPAGAARPEPLVGIIHIRRGHEVGDGRHGDLAAVGCVGLLADHRTMQMEDGRTLIVWRLQGLARFRLDRIDEAAGTPYLMGEVTWLDDFAAIEEGLLLDHARAAEAGLSVADRQAILEITDPAERMRTVERLVRQEQVIRQRFGGRPVHETGGSAGLN